MTLMIEKDGMDMDRMLQEKIDRMAENYERLKNGFAWDYDVVKHFGALMAVMDDREMDVVKIKEIREHIKSSQSFFSNFRGNNEFILAILLMMHDDYKATYKAVLDAHEGLKRFGFKDGMYLPLASYVIGTHVEQYRYNEVFKRMEDFYTDMKRNHFWITSQDDYVLSAVLATTECDVEDTSRDIETCYNLLATEKGMYRGNELQALAHVLSLGEESAAVKCDRAIEIQRQLTDRKCRLNHHGLSSLGVLTLLGVNPMGIADEVVEVKDYLYQKPGYGFWSIDSNLRTILAAGILADYHADRMQRGEGDKLSLMANSVTSVVSAIMVAEQMAIMTAVIASGGAAAATSSS